MLRLRVPDVQHRHFVSFYGVIAPSLDSSVARGIATWEGAVVSFLGRHLGFTPDPAETGESLDLPACSS